MSSAKRFYKLLQQTTTKTNQRISPVVRLFYAANTGIVEVVQELLFTVVQAGIAWDHTVETRIAIGAVHLSEDRVRVAVGDLQVVEVYCREKSAASQKTEIVSWEIGKQERQPDK